MKSDDFPLQNTLYHGEYHAAHPNIVTFWQVFENLTEEEKKKFYCKWKLPAPAVQLSDASFLLFPFHPGFVTGLDRVPYTGMKEVQITVAVLPAVGDAAMPQSLTCYFQLLLPVYQQNPTETMKSRLLQAIHHKRGLKTEDAAAGRIA